MENRATGKTFRLVLRALADASEGNTVIFVQGMRCPAYVMEMVANATRVLRECVYTSFRDHEITFRVPPEGKYVIGTLKIVPYEQFKEGLRSGCYFGLNWRRTKVVFDDCEPDRETRDYLGAWLHV